MGSILMNDTSGIDGFGLDYAGRFQRTDCTVSDSRGVAPGWYAKRRWRGVFEFSL